VVYFLVVFLLVRYFFYLGEHTSSVTTTWTLLNILTNKDVLKNVLSSLDYVFKSNDELTFDNYRNIEEFQIIPMCIRETLRMYPPIIMLFRYVKKDKKLEDGKIIPKGNIVAVSPAFTGRHPDIYPDADKFDPNRWTEERLEHKKKTYSILSFGAGRHRCIGENFALFQVTSILALFFKHLDMKYDKELPSVNYTKYNNF
jgi:sterol 14-demethylase